ncbi:MAG: hypothetical protein LUQ38_08385 [Methanotrichaceae archaeon]|nr:hypothetical protein [Methanotrichaceae archaeon]
MASRSPSTGLTKTIRTLLQPEVYVALETRSGGLSQIEADERLIHHGKNVISEVEKKRLASFAANFTHLMAILLWAGGLIAFAAGLHPLGIAIWMVNIINRIFSYWQE